MPTTRAPGETRATRGDWTAFAAHIAVPLGHTRASLATLRARWAACADPWAPSPSRALCAGRKPYEFGSLTGLWGGQFLVRLSLSVCSA